MSSSSFTSENSRVNMISNRMSLRDPQKIALDLLASGRVAAEPIITHHFPLVDIGEAFAAASDKRGSGAVKVLVHPHAL